jgi:hypothetical protein
MRARLWFAAAIASLPLVCAVLRCDCSTVLLYELNVVVEESATTLHPTSPSSSLRARVSVTDVAVFEDASATAAPHERLRVFEPCTPSPYAGFLSEASQSGACVRLLEVTHNGHHVGGAVVFQRVDSGAIVEMLLLEKPDDIDDGWVRRSRCKAFNGAERRHSLALALNFSSTPWCCVVCRLSLRLLLRGVVEQFDLRLFGDDVAPEDAPHRRRLASSYNAVVHSLRGVQLVQYHAEQRDAPITGVARRLGTDTVWRYSRSLHASTARWRGSASAVDHEEATTTDVAFEAGCRGVLVNSSSSGVSRVVGLSLNDTAGSSTDGRGARRTGDAQLLGRGGFNGTMTLRLTAVTPAVNSAATATTTCVSRALSRVQRELLHSPSLPSSSDAVGVSAIMDTLESLALPCQNGRVFVSGCLTDLVSSRLSAFHNPAGAWGQHISQRLRRLSSANGTSVPASYDTLDAETMMSPPNGGAAQLQRALQCFRDVNATRRGGRGDTAECVVGLASVLRQHEALTTALTTAMLLRPHAVPPWLAPNDAGRVLAEGLRYNQGVVAEFLRRAARNRTHRDVLTRTIVDQLVFVADGVERDLVAASCELLAVFEGQSRSPAQLYNDDAWAATLLATTAVLGAAASVLHDGHIVGISGHMPDWQEHASVIDQCSAVLDGTLQSFSDHAASKSRLLAGIVQEEQSAWWNLTDDGRRVRMLRVASLHGLPHSHRVLSENHDSLAATAMGVASLARFLSRSDVASHYAGMTLLAAALGNAALPRHLPVIASVIHAASVDVGGGGGGGAAAGDNVGNRPRRLSPRSVSLASDADTTLAATAVDSLRHYPPVLVQEVLLSALPLADADAVAMVTMPCEVSIAALELLRTGPADAVTPAVTRHLRAVVLSMADVHGDDDAGCHGRCWPRCSRHVGVGVPDAVVLECVLQCYSSCFAVTAYEGGVLDVLLAHPAAAEGIGLDVAALHERHERRLRAVIELPRIDLLIGKREEKVTMYGSDSFGAREFKRFQNQASLR